MLQADHRGEQEVVLLVDVDVRVAFERCQALIAGPEGGTTVDRVGRERRSLSTFGAGSRRFGPGEHHRVVAGTADEVVGLHGLGVVEPATLQWPARPSAATDLTRRQIHALCVPLALDNYRFWMVVADNTNDRPHRR